MYVVKPRYSRGGYKIPKHSNSNHGLCCSISYKPKLYIQFYPKFCNHQTAISVQICSLEISYVSYDRMPSPIYRYVIDVVISAAIRGAPAVLMNVSCGNIVLLTTSCLNVAQFIIRPQLSFLS
jgi:hypothetical protein